MIFERVFNQWSPEKSTHALETYFKNAHATLCSAVQNLRLGRINLHFEHFRQTFQGGFVVDTFVEMFEMEIVEKGD
jgi:hypothetical protein